MTIYQVAPNRWSNKKPSQTAVKRSRLPLPYVISDTMEPTEQVDGRYYTSKSAFRKVGRQLGLTEVGTSGFQPKTRSTHDASVKHARRGSLRKAVARYRAGERPRHRND